MSEVDKQTLRETIAAACRILALLGVVRETTGHISARTGSNRMLIRCRSNQEAGLIVTEPEAIRELTFDGDGLFAGDADYERPSELPIHGEIYRARPEVMAVVHAHPYASVVCSLAGLRMQPIFGAYDPNSMALGDAGVPTYPRSILIKQKATAHEMIGSMGDKSVCVLHGHGVVTTGESVEEATIRAIKLETLAGVTLDVAKAGGTPVPLSDEDLEFFRKRASGAAGVSREHMKDIWKWTWRHYLKLLSNAEQGPGRA